MFQPGGDDQALRLALVHFQQSREVFGTMLTIRIQGDNRCYALRQRRLHSAPQRRAFALIDRLMQEVSARLLGLKIGRVARTVIHDDDPVNISPGAAHDVGDGRRFVIGRDDDGNGHVQAMPPLTPIICPVI